MVVRRSAETCARACMMATLLLVPAHRAAAQAAPGPYQWLPFDEAFIEEAWYDLLDGSSRADWTGWTGSTWESPNAYNGHTGSDFSLQTGTPLHAAAGGQVVAVVTNVPANSGSGYGNYVRIAAVDPSPVGESLDVITAHMLPNVVVTVGQNVAAGQLVGYSDNTGNSTSEHIHVESLLRGTSTTRCPFYHGHMRYPVMFNKAGTFQVGHVVRVKSTSTPIRSGNTPASPAMATAHEGQMYFACYWQRGHYRIFVPNDAANRAGWIRAIDVDEVLEGTVVQALPDAVTYVHNATLATQYVARETPDDAAAEVGRIVYGGGRFVADQVSDGFYRIPVPGPSPKWGWVKPDSHMVVYPDLVHPSLDVTVPVGQGIPASEDFAVAGKSAFGRAKFNRSVVKSFAPADDGNALFVTDATNSGDGVIETVMAGHVDDRDYSVEVDVHWDYQPSYISGGWQRAGLFLRDDGFTGMDKTFEGRGNAYAILMDSDDGKVRAGKIVDASIAGMNVIENATADGWQTLRIEAEGDTIRFYRNGNLLRTMQDTEFVSGPCGFGYSSSISGFPAGRGIYFDNFRATPADGDMDLWMLR